MGQARAGESLGQIFRPCLRAAILYQLRRVAQERLARRECVVVGVPATDALVAVPARLALAEDLPLAVRLGPDRVVLEQELVRKDAPAGEPRLMPGGAREIHRAAVLPGFDLEEQVRGIAEFEVPEVAFEIRGGLVRVVDGPVVDDGEIHRVEPRSIHPPQRIPQADARPGPQAPLVGVVMNAPGRVEAGGQLGGSGKERTQHEPIAGALRESFDAHEAAPLEMRRRSRRFDRWTSCR